MWSFLVAQVERLPPVEPGKVEYRDIANIVVAFVGVVLAGIAIWMAKRQEEISRRQGTIAEKQDQIMQAQLARRADLHVGETLQDKDKKGVITVKFHVINKGTKTADGFRWEIAYGENVKPHVEFFHETSDPYDAGTVKPVWLGDKLGDMTFVEVINGEYDRKLFPGDRLEILRMRVDSNLKEMKEFYVAWRTRCEDGRVPMNGFATLKFRLNELGFYRTTEGQPITGPTKV
jgi:hypothetical protein